MSVYQSAYYENYSCENALVKIVDDILWSIEEGMVMALMALDLLAVIKCLGTYLDATLSMKTHTTNKCKMAMLNLLKIRNIRKIQTVDACKTLVQGFIISHLNYCNSILSELPDSTIKKFQRI